MIDKEEEIFTRLKYSMSNVCQNIGSTLPSDHSKFPYIYIKQLSNNGIVYSFTNEECATEPVVEIQVYQNGTNAYAIVKKIISLIDEQMLSMGFQRFYGFSDLDTLDVLLKCKVARYRRVLANEDVL